MPNSSSAWSDMGQPQPVLGAGDLGAMRGVHHRVQVGGQVADPGPDGLELAVAPPALAAWASARSPAASATDRSAASTA